MARTRAAVRRCTASRGRRRRRRRRRSGGRWGCGACTRRWGSYIPRTTCTAAGVASSGGRGRASSAAACPSLDGRTPTSFTTACRPRTRTAERLLAGPRRGRRWVHPARRRARGTHARQACERRAAGWRVPAEPTTLQLNPQVVPSPLVAPPLPKSCGARSERTNHVRQPAFAEVVPPIGIGGTPPVFTGVRGLATAGCAPLPGHYRAGCRVFSCSRTQA
jgi:hypothetical protein